MSNQDTQALLPVFGARGLQPLGPLQREIDRVFADFGRGLGGGVLTITARKLATTPGRTIAIEAKPAIAA